ncbi:hypothetical protein BDW68DRAFT_152783 [Aspergillus falconensis]
MLASFHFTHVLFITVSTSQAGGRWVTGMMIARYHQLYSRKEMLREKHIFDSTQQDTCDGPGLALDWFQYILVLLGSHGGYLYNSKSDSRIAFIFFVFVTSKEYLSLAKLS